MLSISHGKEKLRRFFYRNRFSPFNLKVVPVDDLKPGQNPVYVYVLTKGDAEEGNNENGAFQREEENEEEVEKNDVIEEAEEEEDPEPQ